MTKNKAYSFAGSSYEHIMQTVCIRHQVPGFGFFQRYYNQDYLQSIIRNVGKCEENLGSSR